MSNALNPIIEQSFEWKSRTTFILVMIGATLSLKDFLVFPVMAAENGGGAFVLLYVLFLFLIGFPLIISELLIGRFSHGHSLSAFKDLSPILGCSNHWQWIIRGSILASVLLLSIYCVIAGWSLSFVVKMAIGLFENTSSQEISAELFSFQHDPERMMLWYTLFILLLLTISAQGIKLGVERIVSFLVPLMVVLLFVGLSYAIYFGDYFSSIQYFLMPDFSQIDLDVVVLAMERSFFTLSVGLGMFFIFGSKMPSNLPVMYSVSIIIVIDLLFSIVTGLAINALVFSSSGSSEIESEVAFSVLPLIFSSLPMGRWFGSLFYVLLTIAAITTAIALLEVFVEYIRDKFKLSRIRSSAVASVIIWLIGVVAILSYTIWEDSSLTLELYFAGDAYRLVDSASFQDVIIYITSHLLQPAIAFFMVIFMGWVIDKETLYNLLYKPSRNVFDLFYFVVRFIAPTLVLIVSLSSLGVLNYA
ncbi:MAG: sodium-dependent transporter [Gammaproteobacteria bacterium]|nr:sodium-dependent transporter [Gammaproteobacteria bacterium]